MRHIPAQPHQEKYQPGSFAARGAEESRKQTGRSERDRDVPQGIKKSGKRDSVPWRQGESEERRGEEEGDKSRERKEGKRDEGGQKQIKKSRQEEKKKMKRGGERRQIKTQKEREERRRRNRNTPRKPRKVER